MAADLALRPPLPLLTVAAAGLLLITWRRASRLLLSLAVLALTLGMAERLHALLPGGPSPQDASQPLRALLEDVERRKQQLVSSLMDLAAKAAALPETRPALAGNADARSRLFSSLQALSEGARDHPALAIHVADRSTLAWTGRTSDLRAFVGLVGARPDVFVLTGSVSTTLAAAAPIKGPDDRGLGFAVAEIPVMVHRNIRNEYLRDFDLLTGNTPGLEVRYVDAREQTEGPRPLSPPASPATAETSLTAPDGDLLAVARASAPESGPAGRARDVFRYGVSALACLTLLVWAAGTPSDRIGRRLRLALAVTGVRLVPLALGPSLVEPALPLAAPDIYASTLLGPLLKSPLDLFLTALCVACLSAIVMERALAARPTPAPAARSFAVDVLGLPLLAILFAWVADTVANCALDIERISLVPESTVHLVMHVALLLILASGAMLLTALQSLAGALPASLRGRILRYGGWTTLGLLAFRFWPRRLIGLPLVPALALFLAAAVLAGTRHRWLPRLRAASLGAKVGLGLSSVTALALLLYPSLVHFGEKNTRLQIERDHAPLVLRQPEWREYVLQETRERIDALQVLEEAPPGPRPPGIEELAFAVWSATDLAAFGFSSAVEIQDASGAVVSRFALNLPSLSGAPRPLPSSEEWETSREEITVASASRRVLHARRLLSYHGEVHGGIHVYVGGDFWNLPFVTARDPYSVLFRTSPRGLVHERPIDLLVYGANGALLFSSAERPPTLEAALVDRLRKSASGLWTTLEVDGRPHHTFLFTGGQAVYGLAYPRLGAGRYAADLIEAAAGLTLVALLGFSLFMLARTLLGRPTLSLPSVARTIGQRFALRLFVAFILLAFLPAAVLQVAARSFVAERLRAESDDQALELARVAQKAVEDYALLQRGERPKDQPVTDAALVYVASLIRNDLDVFERGRLLASSKRELYASGLLPARVSAPVFRALTLEGQRYVIRTERIGGFSYRVVSVPVRLETAEPGILSIPLALRQKDVQATLDDLDRNLRLASVLFLGLAAVLAHSMARRISGPLRDLTAATQRIARGDLEARVSTTRRDELRGLVESFNRMAGDLGRQRRDLERSNRLAAWAEMARQVAHEVKNPLTPIQLSAEHLRRVFSDATVDFPSTLMACTDTILKQVRILRGIVTEFTAFGRPPTGALEPLDLPSLVLDVVKPYQAGLPPGVTMSLDLGNGIPLVRGDRRLLERAVVNLVENALQAVGDRGAITVRLVSTDGGRVRIEVEDSGPGIEPELRDKVFEPFFSTKTSGSGLGLALVKKIAEDHGGGAELHSAPGETTRAVIWLPAEAPASSPTAQASARETETAGATTKT